MDDIAVKVSNQRNNNLFLSPRASFKKSFSFRPSPEKVSYGSPSKAITKNTSDGMKSVGSPNGLLYLRSPIKACRKILQSPVPPSLDSPTYEGGGGSQNAQSSRFLMLLSPTKTKKSTPFRSSRNEQSLDSVETMLSAKDEATLRIQSAILRVKEEKLHIENELSTNFGLAKERMTEIDSVCSPSANRIVAALAMDRVRKNEQQLEGAKLKLRRLKELMLDVDENLISLEDIDDEIKNCLDTPSKKEKSKSRTVSDNELLIHLSRSMLKEVLE